MNAPRMDRLWYDAPGEVAWRPAPRPTLQAPHGALVRPRVATTCDLDVMILRGTTPFQGPIALGHECVAEVVELGAQAHGLSLGQLVVVPWHVSCGACPRCRRRLPNTCETFPPGAMFGMDIAGDYGSFFSDLVYVPHAGEMLTPLPAGLDPVACASASLACATSRLAALSSSERWLTKFCASSSSLRVWLACAIESSA